MQPYPPPRRTKMLNTIEINDKYNKSLLSTRDENIVNNNKTQPAIRGDNLADYDCIHKSETKEQPLGFMSPVLGYWRQWADE